MRLRVETIDEAHAELDMAHVCVGQMSRDLDRLRRSVRALAGLASNVFESVTPYALRAVLTRRGWVFREVERDYEQWRHPYHDDPVCVPVDGPLGIKSIRWAIDELAGPHVAKIAPAELLAELLAADDDNNLTQGVL